ncbi:MAG: phosphatidylserine decarboxylase [Lachnospiraceae bacterium]
MCIRTENFGTLLQMEVGAMMVGRIKNYHGPKQVKKGGEKGRFDLAVLPFYFWSRRTVWISGRNF